MMAVLRNHRGITTYMKSIQPSKTSKEEQENKASKEDKDETAEEEVVGDEGENEEPESSTRPDRNTDEITTTRRTSSRTSRSTTRSRSSTTLLGVDRRDVLPTLNNLFPIPTSTASHLVKRNDLQVRQNNPSRSTLTVSPSSNNYVPNSDVPLRDGAVGFTASSHLFAAFVILLLFWLEFMLFMKKPTMLTYWGPLIIACVQLYMAFDILGRV